ncbi:MAG: NAD(P)H-hydrate epimerase [Planctomycetota bacterium]
MHAPNARPLSVAEVRAVDTYAVEHLRIPGVVLMENAARGLARAVLRDAPRSVAVLCGHGNNGGDGFAAARHLVDHADVRVGLIGRVADLRGDAAANAVMWQACGGAIEEFDRDTPADTFADRLAEADTVVDALLGTGTTGPPRAAFAAAIQAINTRRAGTRVVAADVPSGLDADAGVAPTPTVRADRTVTFVAPKTGFDTAAAREHLGEVTVVGIGVPGHAIEAALAAR